MSLIGLHISKGLFFSFFLFRLCLLEMRRGGCMHILPVLFFSSRSMSRPGIVMFGCFVHREDGAGWMGIRQASIKDAKSAGGAVRNE